MAVGSATATAMLGALPGTLYVQAHSGEPGPAGTDNVIAGSTRGLATFPAAAGGIRSASGSSDCPGIPQGASVSHVSYWDALSGGTFRFSHALAVSVSFIYAGTLRFESQVLSVTTGATGSQTQTSVNVDSALAVDTNTTTRIVVHTDTATTSDSSGATVGIIDATTDTASTSDAVGVGHLIHLTDSSSTSDAVGISPSLVVDDTATTGDENGAVVGAFSGADDAATTSDSNAITQVFVSSNTDTASTSDSNTAQEQQAGGSAPTFVAAGTAHASTPGIPAGIQADDVLVMLVAGYGGSTPSGWTAFSGGPLVTMLYWKRTTGSESSPTLTGAGQCQIAAFRGCIASGDPIDVVSSQVWSDSTSPILLPSITTTVSNTLVCAAMVGIYASLDSVGSTPTTADAFKSGGTTPVWLRYGAQASAGASGTTALNWSGEAAEAAGRHFALKPAA